MIEKKNNNRHPGLMAQAYNPTTWEAEAGGLYRFKATLVSFVRLCIKIKSQKRTVAEAQW